MSNQIGYMPEERGLYPKKGIKEQLVYFGQLKGMNRQEAIKSVEYWLDRTEMKDYSRKKLETLSKGNQQKIQLIATLVHDPDVIILDEPFSGLDPVNAKLLKDIVIEQISSKKLVIFSSHQMNYIEEFCTDIIILTKGEKVLDGDLREIKKLFRKNKLVVQIDDLEKITDDYPEAEVDRESREVIIDMPKEMPKSIAMQDIITKYDVNKIGIQEPSLQDIFIQYAND